MPIGTALVIGSNIVETNISDELKKYDGEIGDVREDLQKETEARTEADTSLSEAIRAEATARGEADTALSEAIQAEAEARADADTEIKEELDRLTLDAEYKTYTVEGRSIKCHFEKTGSYQITNSRVLNREALNGDYTGFYIQSCEYIGRDRFVIGMSNSTYSDSLLVVVDKDLNILDRYSINLGHCNDLAYDSVRGKIYVATMDTGSYPNSLVILNSNTFTIENIIELGSSVARVAYDALNDLIYIIRGGVSTDIFEIMDPANNNIIKSYNTNNLAYYIPGIVTQGGVVIEGNFYQVGCKWGWLDSDNGAYLFNTRPDGTIGNKYAFPQMSGDEAEGVTTDGESLYIFAHNYVTGNVHVYTYPLNNSSVSFNATLFSGYGLQLKDGDDLNQLVDGKYNKPKGATIVANWPPNPNGGSVYQFGAGYDHNFQIAFLNNGMVFTRNRASQGPSGSWGKWISMAGDVLVGYQNIDLAGAYITTGGKDIIGSLPGSLYISPNLANFTITVRSVSGSYLILARPLSEYIYTITKTANNCRILVQKQDGTAYDGAVNNSPVAVNLVGTA